MLKSVVLGLLMAQQAWAQAAPARPGILEQLMPFVFVLIIFYFFLIRPQAKRMKTHQQFLSGLKNGDAVVTEAGIYGVVAGITDQFVTLEIDDRVKIRVLKNKVAQPFKEGSQK